MHLKAFLVPHPPIMVSSVGGEYLDQIPETVAAMNEISVRIKHSKPRSLIIMSPHSPIQPDIFCIKDASILSGDLRNFGAPNSKVAARVDEELKQELIKSCDELQVPYMLLKPEGEVEDSPNDLRWEGLDHGVIAPLLYIFENGEYKLNSISYSWLSIEDHYRFGMAIQKAVLKFNEEVVFIVSGDLSHRLTKDAPAGYNPRGLEFDSFIYSALKRKDFKAILNIEQSLRRSAGECGMNSIFTMLGFFDGFDVDVEILSYEGPFGVGYMTAEISSARTDNEPGEAIHNDSAHAYEQASKALTGLAREAVVDALGAESGQSKKINADSISSGENYSLSDDDLLLSTGDLLEKPAACFVSIKKHGELRGCIGTIYPMENDLEAEIRRNAISAAFQDPRFPGVTHDELSQITFSVDVLTEPQHIDNRNLLDPKKYGVIVKAGNRQGLLLPDLEGVETIDRQIQIAASKGGISANEKFDLFRFEVIRYKELADDR